jgi:hypothetical protein
MRNSADGWIVTTSLVPSANATGVRRILAMVTVLPMRLRAAVTPSAMIRWLNDIALAFEQCPTAANVQKHGYKGIFMSLLPRRGSAAKAWSRTGSPRRQSWADAGFPPKGCS